jgi:hypothetical protein
LIGSGILREKRRSGGLEERGALAYIQEEVCIVMTEIVVLDVSTL